MIRNWLLLTAIAVTASALAVSSPANANLVISLDDGAGNSIVVGDGGGSDLNGVDGGVTWVGGLGVWSINVSTGISDPALGTKALPNLDLNSVNNSSSAAGSTMTVMITDTDFTTKMIGEVISLLLDASATTDGTIAFDLYIDDGNAEFGMTQLLASAGPFVGPGAFADSVTGFGTATDLYAITLVVTIDHNGSNTGEVTSFDAEITRVPEPTTLAIFGAGLIMLGGLVRKRKRATA